MVIKESFLLAADDADVLAAPSRLASLPSAGLMTIEASATQCTATNNGTMTLQMPDGEIPFEGLIIPYNGYSATDGIIHDDTALQVEIPVPQGGHVGIVYDETGTVAFCLIIVTLTF